MGKVCVGIDVSKDKLDVALEGNGKVRQFRNNEDGHKELLDYLSDFKIDLILMEATGGFESKVAYALKSRDYDVAVKNPRYSRNFASSMGYLAKTDKIDAKILKELTEILSRHRFSGKRSIYGGWALVRKVLYMSTIVAIRWNRVIKTFYERLIARGKAKKVATVSD